MTIRQSDRANLLGVGISAINMDQALETIQAWITRREPHYVCVTPAHSIMDCYNNPELRLIFNRSGLTTPDGMSVVWTLRLMGHKHVGRVYGPDLMHALCQHSLGHGYRHYFYGGAPDVVEDLTQRLETDYPGLQIVGHYTPPFGPVSEEEDQQIIKDISQRSGFEWLYRFISEPRRMWPRYSQYPSFLLLLLAQALGLKKFELEGD
jgi:N-acetylglucosaminyldiphosphoundecaprenol N-acetyl-beta-D-mannosaminyltransferase